MSSNAASRHGEAYVSLMRGLPQVDFRGPAVPSDLVLIGSDAFPLAMNTRGQVLVAASQYGSGRIVVLGHEAYMTAFPDLLGNALTWLRGGESGNPAVGVHQHCAAVANSIIGSPAHVMDGFDETLGVGVYVTNAYSVEPYAQSLVRYLKAGGGVLIAGQAWSWAEQNPKENTLMGFPGNKVSSVAGIYFSEHRGELECIPVYPNIPSSWLRVAIDNDFSDDLDVLLQGVSQFDIQCGLPSEVLVHGPLAFPIGTSQDGRAFLAGAYYGQGRVIVITHEGLLARQELSIFWTNALRWLDEGRNGVIGVTPCLENPLSLYSQSGFTCEKTDFRKGLSVFVCTAYSDSHLEEIQHHVAEGGGLLIGGHAWYWAQTNPGRNHMTEFSGNRILNKMGLSVLSSTVEAGCYPAPVPSEAFNSYNFRRLLRSFAGHVTQGDELSDKDEARLKRLGGDCSKYLNMKSYDCSSYKQVVSTLTEVLMKSGIPQVCDTAPVQNPKDHLLLSVGAEVYKVCPDADALLPYLIRDNPVMPVVYNSKIKINANTAGAEEWISTGLYLTPGMKTYMSTSAQMNTGWKVQIGCHTDHLHAEELKRAPCVHERYPITGEMRQVCNLWGGLIYLVAPPNTQVEGAEVVVQIAVPAPYYKSGVTTLADWAVLRTAPAPWAELEFDNIIITVPSDDIRGLENPDELAALWNDMMNGIADLAAVPHKFPRKERYVTDVQISHGWMHAGYPVMMYKSVAPELVNTKSIRESGVWGPIHELGHNQQRGCWEFPTHTTECTCNLWSVYVHEEVLGIDKAKAHPNMALEHRRSRAQQYIKEGRNLNSWDMWVALETYMQLQDRFGWDAFKKVFTAYHTMTNVPGDNKGKMNLYAQTFSEIVGMNLCGFFKDWGWPIEPATEGKVSCLPPWSDHPMV